MFVRECLILGNGLKYNVTNSLKSMPYLVLASFSISVKVSSDYEVFWGEIKPSRRTSHKGVPAASSFRGYEEPSEP